MSLEPGQHFGRFVIAELLGRGGMGEVYRAQDTLLDRPVALKVVRPPTGGGDAITEDLQRKDAARILREARTAACIDHPNAIAIYDVGEVSGIPFLAMELVKGSSLRTLQRGPPIPLAVRIRWLAEVARALAAAHALGVVHRDIKPENVMVREDGVVKVLDFGIARRTAPALDPNAPTQRTSGTLTGEGLIFGTPRYMAPEQMRGDAVDGRADQFSWGVVAYELLTGTFPWKSEDDGVLLLAQILLREVESASLRNPEIPAPVDAVIRQALDKSAGKRLASMDAVARVLERYGTAAAWTTKLEASALPAQNQPEVELAPTRDGDTPPGSAPVAAPAGKTAPRPRSAARVAGGLLLVALGAGASLRWWAAPRRGAPAAPQDAAVALETDFGVSASSDATVAYRAGMQALRDACLESVQTNLDQAVVKDHWFAAAHLGRAVLASASDRMNVTAFQESLRDARTTRTSLAPRGLALLDALEPWALVPPDLEESKRRFEAATGRYPRDPLLAFELGMVLDRSNDTDGATRAFERAIAIDPSFAMAFRMIARERVESDDVAEALEADRRCVEISPSATWCLRDLARLQANEGKCAELESSSRRMAELSPDSTDAPQFLAGALASEGRQVEVVRAALEQEWERYPPESRRSHQIEDEASLGLLTGDFAMAAERYREDQAEMASSPREMDHFFGAYGVMLVDSETEQNADLLRGANEYLRSRAAWQPNSFGLDPTMYVYALELAAGGIDGATFAERRARWVPGVSVGDGYAWAIAWALPARTPEDAKAALSVEPTYRPLVNALEMTPGLGESMGRVYLLAGRLDEATALLRQASESCALFGPWQALFATRASLELGEVLEARNDVPGACVAYQRVLARWGSAKPGSRTGRAARTRAERLRCPQ